MNRELIVTSDGSHSIRDQQTGAAFHSMHGAIQESEQVYINVLRPVLNTKKTIHVLEMGFGTGLNALLTRLAIEDTSVSVRYTALERYPLSMDMVQQLNYCDQLKSPEFCSFFQEMHACPWETDQLLSGNFMLHKIKAGPEEMPVNIAADIVYYDAFAPEVQPELWTTDVFTKMASAMQPGGILATYCSKVAIQKAMKAAGLTVQKRPGPWGKREVISAYKP